MSSPEPLCGALAGFTLMRFLVFYILANWFPKHRTARTSKLEYSIGVESGNKVIWIKPYKKSPLRTAKRAYKQFNYDILPVSRKCCGDKILSKSVNYVIYLLSRDLNGQKAVKTVFAIVGEQHILLSDTICGHNGLEGQFESSAMELEKFLCDSFGIDKRNIRVEQIEQFL